MTLPFAEITRIPNNEPDAIPSLWNDRYAEIDQNFHFLESATPQLVATAATAAGVYPATGRVLTLDGSTWRAVNGAPAGTYTSNGGTVGGVLQPGTVIAHGDGSAAWVRNGEVTVDAFGAKSDWNISAGSGTNSTASFLSAAEWARTNRRKVIIPSAKNGHAYYVDSSIDLTGFDFYGAVFEGETSEGAKIVSGINGFDPLFLLNGGSGGFTNAGLRNIKIIPRNRHEGTAIKVNGNCFSILENIVIEGNFKVGLWLFNESQGSFTEVTNARRIVILDCDESIRIEKGNGENSFNGTSIEASIRVSQGQKGLVVRSGAYLYNFNLRLKIWTSPDSGLGDPPIIIENNGNCEKGTVDIAYEIQGSAGRITGAGRFHADGYLNGLGNLVDETTTEPGSGSGFVITNFITPRTPTSSALTDGGISKISGFPGASGNYNGLCPSFVRVSGENRESVGVIVYDHYDNGLYVLGEGFQQGIKDVSVHHAILKTRWSIGNTPFRIDPIGGSGQLQINSSGSHSGRMGRNVSGIVPANNGVLQTVTVEGVAYQSRIIESIFSLVIEGAEVDYRYLYAMVVNGYGEAGYLAKLATLREYSNTDPGNGIYGVVLQSSCGVNRAGNLWFQVKTDRQLTYYIKNVGIGEY